MILILAHTSNLTEKKIIEQVYKRFLPGENEMGAKSHIKNKLEEYKISYKIKDFCHHHSQEKTFTSVIDTFKSAIFSLFKTFSPENKEQN